MTWPSATSGTSTPAPPQATKERAAPGHQLLEEPGGERRTHARMHDAPGAVRPAPPRRSGCARSRRRRGRSTRPSCPSTTVVITSWKKHSTTWGGTSIGSMTSPGSITALGVGSNSRIGASGAGSPGTGGVLPRCQERAGEHQRDPHDRDTRRPPRPGTRRPGPSRRRAPSRSRTPPGPLPPARPGCPSARTPTRCRAHPARAPPRTRPTRTTRSASPQSPKGAVQIAASASMRAMAGRAP